MQQRDSSSVNSQKELSGLREERLQRLISEVNDYAIILLDASGVVISWNKGAEKIKGYEAAEIIGKSFKIFYTEEDRNARLPETLLETAHRAGKATHEVWRVRKDGSRFWGNITITSTHADNGDVVGFLKVTRDLTERKVSEENHSRYVEQLEAKNKALKDSEERYHKMVTEVRDYAILLLDKNGVIQNWNVGAQSIKGYRAEEIIGSSFDRFYTEADRDAGVPPRLLALAARDGKASEEGWRVRKNGTRFWAYVVITALHNEHGEIIGFSKVTLDQTAKKEAEDLLHANAVELDRKNKSLERLNSEVSSFAYVASHDLKEPLRKIQMFTSQMMESDQISDIRAYAEKISDSAVRMQRLIEDLLAYSHISDEQSTFVSVDLNAVVKDAIGDLELTISERKAKLEIAQLPTVQGVYFQLHQVFLNLFSNALKFSSKEVVPEIKVTSKRIDGKEILLTNRNDAASYYQITITDNGIGFDSIHSEKIFEVFQRLHPKTKYNGTGIGLAIVKKVMVNHGGFVLAHGAPMKGASFDLIFPAQTNDK